MGWTRVKVCQRVLLQVVGFELWRLLLFGKLIEEFWVLAEVQKVTAWFAFHLQWSCWGTKTCKVRELDFIPVFLPKSFLKGFFN